MKLHASNLFPLVLAMSVASPTSAQLTTWKEDMTQAKQAESRHDYAEAERYYRSALRNFRDRAPQRAVTLSDLSTGQYAAKSCDCEDEARCVETLTDLLAVLYAEKKFSSAISVFKGLMAYKERHATGANDPTLVAAKANYKKLVQRVQTNKRWSELAPLFKEYKFVGMDRTRLHEVMGAPNAATDKCTDMSGASVTVGRIPGVGSTRGTEFPTSDIPNKGRRDFYVLSMLAKDAPQPSFGQLSLRLNANAIRPMTIAQNDGPYSFLDIDFVDDRLTRYRLRSLDHVGRWTNDNKAPDWPDDEAI